MQNKPIRITAMLLAILCLVPLLSFGSLNAVGADAGEDQVMYVEKYVSVLYDNSGSMDNSDLRQYYAEYAAQMLASMMNGEDLLWVVPMNKPEKVNDEIVDAEVSDAALVPFTDNRETDIKTFAATTLKKFAPFGYTPLASIKTAAERLYKTDDITGFSENKDRKHWLVILTDGVFTDETRHNVSEYETTAALKSVLDAYPDMNLVYIGTGEAKDLSNLVAEGGELEGYKTRFFPKKAGADTVVATMRDVANMMSDRYTLTPEDYPSDFITIAEDGKSAAIKLSYLPFPLNSISFSVQNFGGKVTSAAYSGKTFTPANCIITPPTALNMKSGTTGIIRDSSQNPMLFNTSDGKDPLTLYFDQPISADNIALMAEPSLYIQPVFQRKDGTNWVECTLRDVMKNQVAGDLIKVGYRVYNGATNRPYEGNELPGKTYGTVFAGGVTVSDNLTPGSVSQAVKLAVGQNDIKLSISLMDGIYRLEKTVHIDIVGSVGTCKMTAEKPAIDPDKPYKSVTVFVPTNENKPMTKAELSDYTGTVTVSDPSGDEINADAAVILRDDGTYAVELGLADMAFGEYIVKLAIRSGSTPLQASALATVPNYPAAITLDFVGEDSIVTSETAFERGQKDSIGFALFADGKPLDFDCGLLSYRLMFGDNEIKRELYHVSGNKLTFVPDKESVGAFLSKGPHTYKIKLLVENIGGETDKELKDEKEATLEIAETVVTVKALGDMMPIDRFEIEDTPAEAVFAVFCDGEALTREELAVAIGQAEKDENTETIGKLTIKSDWCDAFFLPVNLSSPEVISLTYEGKEIAAVRVTVLPGHVGFVREHLTAWLIANGEKPITAAYENTAAKGEVTTAFVLQKSGFWSYLWRFLVILLWIHLLLCFVLNGKCNRHKKGYFVCLVVGPGDAAKPTVKVTPVNMSFMQRALPLRWFIPFYPVMTQKAKGDSGGHIAFDFRHIEKGANGKAKALDKSKPKMVFKRAALVFQRSQLNGEAAGLFDQYAQKCKNQIPTASTPPILFNNGKMRQMFPPIIEHNDSAAASNFIPKYGVSNRGIGVDYIYAFYTERSGAGGKVVFDKLQRVIFFVPKK